MTVKGRRGTLVKSFKHMGLELTIMFDVKFNEWSLHFVRRLRSGLI